MLNKTKRERGLAAMAIWKKRYQYWGFILPVLIPFLLFSTLPLLLNVYYSLMNWDGISMSREFAGFGNYLTIFGDRLYKKAFSFNFKLMLWNMSVGNCISLGMALLASSGLRMRNLARACFFSPMVISAIVTGFLWKFFFFSAPNLKLGLFKSNWLSSPKMAVWGMYLVGMWKGSGNGMVYYLAGLMNIDETYYESAKVDGANGWVSFWKITLPLLMPMITVNLFLTITGAFNIYDLTLALTDGGPANSTAGLAYRVYTVTFVKGSYGLGSAMAIVLAVIVMTFSLIQVSITRRRETRL